MQNQLTRIYTTQSIKRQKLEDFSVWTKHPKINTTTPVSSLIQIADLHVS